MNLKYFFIKKNILLNKFIEKKLLIILKNYLYYNIHKNKNLNISKFIFMFGFINFWY
jgi:hypothetical protein